MTRRLGLLGGTFDPVHLGHLIACEAARTSLGLDAVLFVPAGDPPHKSGAPISPARQRLAMLALALAGNPAFAVSRVDVDRPGPHFTVDLLRLVAEEYGPATELYFIVGADSLVDLPTWRQPERIVQLARLAVVGRPGYEPDLADLERRVPGVADSLRFVDAPPVDISATDLRRRVAAGRSIRYQVPDAVADYVQTHGLYRELPQPDGSPSGGRLTETDPPVATAKPRLLAATTNPGKLREFRALLADLDLEVVSPADIGLSLDVAETGVTFEENARLKALAYAAAADLPALADDSGLAVDALDGFPGVASARWVAGTDADRVAALLARLADVPAERRSARFRAVAALAWPGGRVETAEGKVEGRLATSPRGAGGFGYDPIFLLEDAGYRGEVTTAELTAEEKNRLSHRGRAVRGLRASIEALLR